MTTRADALAAATRRLEAAGVPNGARDARLLMRHVLGLSAASLSADTGAAMTHEAAFATGIARRAAREPLSHITGTRIFWEHSFTVTRDVLDPRPETEVLVAEALNRGPFQSVLDLGTGSGCILLSLLAAWPDARGTGTDCSQAALSVAASNAQDLGLAARTDWHCGDWFEGIEDSFDLIVSNPPYLAATEINDLEPEVREHEPRHALTPGRDGLGAYEAIAARALSHLRPGGWVMLEIGPTQSEVVCSILANAGFLVRGIIPDLDHRPRVIIAQ